VTEQSKNQRRFIVRTGIGFLPLPTGKCTVTCINSGEQNDPTHKIVNTEQHGFHRGDIIVSKPKEIIKHLHDGVNILAKLSSAAMLNHRY
jgi:hypothetical protein